jgi:CMP/dCMP kinase
MIISLSGAQGSGKSTIAKKIASQLNWPRYYIGGIRRQIAKDKGLTLAQYNKLGETDPSTDLEVDDYQKELGQKEDNFIIEGRTSWFFIPHSFKIYLDVKESEGAKRILAHLQQDNERNEDQGLVDKETMLLSLAKRAKSDAYRYRKYYNIDVHDRSHYDYILDTTYLNEKEVFEKVMKEINKRKALDT